MCVAFLFTDTVTVGVDRNWKLDVPRLNTCESEVLTCVQIAEPGLLLMAAPTVCRWSARRIHGAWQTNSRLAMHGAILQLGWRALTMLIVAGAMRRGRRWSVSSLFS